MIPLRVNINIFALVNVNISALVNVNLVLSQNHHIGIDIFRKSNYFEYNNF
jgi:hypothetical protein